jgi:hypothetical protein
MPEKMESHPVGDDEKNGTDDWCCIGNVGG